jgi:superfamily II DNA or RNA helicase
MAKQTGAKKAEKPARGKGGGKSKAAEVLERNAANGWATSDEDEIERRRWRGQTEIGEVVAARADQGFFGNFFVRSASGAGGYEVEIRSLDAFANSCGCIDHRVNHLGTCKHIEGVLAALRRGRVRAFRTAAEAGGSRTEVYLDRRGDAKPAILWSKAQAAEARAWLAPWLEPDGTLTAAPERIAEFLAQAESAPASVRVSRHFGPWIERARRAAARAEAAATFAQEVEAGRATLDVLRSPLLPYQRAGAMHLAFGERALLADEMGLGKTIQAIAACELLARRKGVERVLVVCPASLKGEWEEQIARFCERSVRLVFGGRDERLQALRDPAFFTIVNYEQVLVDAEVINETLKPDVVVLDEAQRIKNWQTKTARRVKSLRSPFAFVLTGTPLENRIDELYSIVQYLDAEVLGPLFRFNRDFYELDERGRPANYKNLSELRRRIAPLMLRRRKAEVEKELPGRTIKTYFVPLAEEQIARYDEYRQPAAQLLALAQRRPLRKQEFERLQMLLSCMRMICDTPAILDPTCRVSPKLEELERILTDLLEDGDRKIIVFSEWERMLTLVRELAGEMGIEVAWHTGSLPQERRRAEINRFKRDPACRLFLSTDSGATGLNLQVASAVVNMDLPWNPAKLEQRIARAWRKNQTRSVAVINLVAEKTIEHNILHLLGQKQALADGVLDGLGDVGNIDMPSGRGAFIERMNAVMADAELRTPRVVTLGEALASELRERLGEALLLVEERRTPAGVALLFVVLDADAETLAAEEARAHASGAQGAEFMDPAGWRRMQRLASAGLMLFSGAAREHYRSPALAPETPPAKRSAQAEALEADRALRMAKALCDSGFPEEAPPLLAKSLRALVSALAATRGEESADIRRLVESGALSGEALSVLDAAQDAPSDATAKDVAPLFSAMGRIFGAVARNEPGLAVRAQG